MDSLFRYTAVLLAIVLVVLLIALITGPYPWAVALRGWVRDLGRMITSAFGGERMPDEGRLRWMREHRDGLMLGGAIVAVALLFLADLSFWGFLVVAAALALYEIALSRLGRAEEPEPGGSA
jgi:uncharacterized iron-regulated membrane protein